MTTWCPARQPSMQHATFMFALSLVFHMFVLLLAALLATGKTRPPRVILTSGQSAEVMRITLVSPNTNSPSSPQVPSLTRTARSLSPTLPEIPLPLPDDAGLPLPEKVSQAEPPEPEARAPVIATHGKQPPEMLRLPSRSVRPARQHPLQPAPSAQQVINRNRGVRRGVKTAHVPVPRYPRASRARGEEGVVVVEVLVTPSGRASTVRLQRPCSYPRLNRAALMAAQNARFLPAMERGTPTAAVSSLKFKFVLFAH